MKTSVALAIALVACTVARTQETLKQDPVDLSHEPHHKLLFENAQVRAFSLELQPNEATLPHRHNNLYAYISLDTVTIANEVRGRTPVVIALDAGEVHTSRGGFTLAERNTSSQAAHLVVIEALKQDASPFATPMGGFRYHEAAFGELFQFPAMRGYAMTIAAGGHTEEHHEGYDRLVIAVTDLDLREDVAGQLSSELKLGAGEVTWLPRGISHVTTNIGK